MATDLSHVEGMFKFNTDIVNRAIQGVSAEDWYRKPGDDSNHLMWVMGHLVAHRGQTLKILGVAWDAAWAPLFSRGSDRVDDAEYPSKDEMLAAWNSVSADLSAALQNSSADALAKEAPKGPPSFDGKTGGTVAFYAFHDTYHVGQVSFLRKWLGYGQTIG